MAESGSPKTIDFNGIYFAAGVGARKAGKPITDAPDNKGSQLADSWRAGWTDEDSKISEAKS